LAKTAKPTPTTYDFLERIAYYNEENDFVVAMLKQKGKGESTPL
jgi:hypothetical protein